jgi:hypothetical protein
VLVIEPPVENRGLEIPLTHDIGYLVKLCSDVATPPEDGDTTPRTHPSIVRPLWLSLMPRSLGASRFFQPTDVQRYMRSSGLEPPPRLHRTRLDPIRPCHIRPPASRSSVLYGFADASDTSDEMTCVRDVSRASCPLRTHLKPPCVRLYGGIEPEGTGRQKLSRERPIVLGDTQRTSSQPGWLAVIRLMFTVAGRALPGRPFEQVRKQFPLLDRIIEGVVGMGRGRL